MPNVAIRRAQSGDLPEAARLLAAGLGFTAADAVPAWLMRTTDECGGLTLVAASGTTIVGVSYAVPARAGDTAFLFSCGLAVVPEQRGRRLGLQLKLAQRREAIAAGYSTIRWTTDPVNGRALRVYLSGLGAADHHCHGKRSENTGVHATHKPSLGLPSPQTCRRFASLNHTGAPVRCRQLSVAARA